MKNQLNIEKHQILGCKGIRTFTIILPIEAAYELNIESSDLLRYEVQHDEIVIKKWIPLESSNKTNNNNNGEIYGY